MPASPLPLAHPGIVRRLRKGDRKLGVEERRSRGRETEEIKRGGREKQRIAREEIKEIRVNEVRRN